MRLKAGMALAVGLLASGAWAQSALTLPNNSAGSPLDTPPMITPEAAAKSNVPARSDSSGAAFQKLDKGGMGYVTREEFARMGSGDFDAADTNRDGRLSYDEFQRYWTGVQGGKD